MEGQQKSCAVEIYITITPVVRVRTVGVEAVTRGDYICLSNNITRRNIEILTMCRMSPAHTHSYNAYTPHLTVYVAHVGNPTQFKTHPRSRIITAPCSKQTSIKPDSQKPEAIRDATQTMNPADKRCVQVGYAYWRLVLADAKHFIPSYKY